MKYLRDKMSDVEAWQWYRNLIRFPALYKKNDTGSNEDDIPHQPVIDLFYTISF